ncbi:putative carbamoyl-phosphate synthase large subunit [Babesia bovis T2Bo]|uniref:Carbamoyl phosphate synthetase n=1 Tax=Babesia bovis TaxID=5865 RepID=A7AMY9_BABBO|nr:putative carbamoyl-phosphate synthase large subunit [Babesia bovis T2Bo]EDO07923.1 putative carbamoyl-phosphate synthase large subunit [Babesia bovis T2Bo]|eukprot:XP_001611491.1 carbamoyl phosphate synthetase [Babesia bovis T2Bo]
MGHKTDSAFDVWRPEELTTPLPAKLLLQDGTEFNGYSFGYVDENYDYADPTNLSATGEVVFSTSMVGYAEALTDPSFLGQILVLTYPSVGNTGVPPSEQDEFGVSKWFESSRIHVNGFVCCDYSIYESHWSSCKSLSTWLREERIPAISGIDTRALTKHLRNCGSTLARIIIGPKSRGLVSPRLLESSSFYDTNNPDLMRSLPDPHPVLYTMAEIDGERYVTSYEFTVAELDDILSRDPYACTSSDLDVHFASKKKFCGYPNKPVNDCASGSGSLYSSSLSLKGVTLVVIVDCGIKSNIIRLFLRMSPVQVRALVVPHNFDFNRIPYDGLILSNGPGDPSDATVTIANLRRAMERTTPIFGICLGHQLMGLAAGAKTYKMRYGHRGFNQPCVDLRTSKCYMTSQNHGYAIDEETLPSEWSTLFVNANDGCVEGIIHMTYPWFSVQFHPEASGGPTDTLFLMRDFIYSLGKSGSIPLHIRSISPHVQWKRILLLSSGGISIGQAGEFDYSGSQAIKALKESGAEVILVNPNVATVQTNHGLADVVYFEPITAEFVSNIIEKERPDGIMCSFGGQTALNCGIDLYKSGILSKYNCEVLGTPIETIINTEDRALFNRKLAEIGERCAPSKVGTDVGSCISAAQELGYPVLVRTNYALGGFGSGLASDESELRSILSNIFSTSSCRKGGSDTTEAGSGSSFPVEDVCVYIDKALKGWKEIEFEIIRDNNDNCISPASMENFDPLGIHTGDSIVVAPAQTLTNVELYKYREIAFKIVRHLGIVGECNVQFAVNPDTDDYFIVELNARLSRSSALASKATGYPLAYFAARIALGFDLVQMRNAITLVTTACFEPSLDYIVVKIPKWDLRKFEYADNLLGSSMKSVGEVMSIGRTFEEAMQKALRMAGDGVLGFNSGVMSGADREAITDALRRPTPDHVAAIARAFELGMTVSDIHGLTKIDPWFLHRLHHLHILNAHLSTLPSLSSFTPAMMRYYKVYGFSDRQISREIVKSTVSEDDVRELRKSWGIVPFVKVIDTMAAEYPAKTNYCYLTYNGIESDVLPCGPIDSKDSVSATSIVVLGCGPYRIGSSIEFDWSAVSCVKALRSLGHAAVIVNCNPETVSTDYDVSDRLYFDELTVEIVDAIYHFENPKGIVISVGGQTANNLACKLHSLGLSILGTSVESIDRCENRNKFSKLCDVLGIDQPAWEEFTSFEGAKQFCTKVSFPVLVRPSYVLSGASMRVIVSFEELEKYLQTSAVVNREHPVVISKFIEKANEVEVDCVASQGIILNYAISEHVEHAGTHSGDATLILPAQNIFVGTHRRVKKITQKLSRYLNISGPFNVQYLCKNNEIKIIECNLRASRTLPFIYKTLNVNFIDQATRVMVGSPARVHNIQLMDIDYVAVKVPVFSFDRLSPSDPVVGVDMKSTGEVVGFGANKYEALLKAMMASNVRLPTSGMLISLDSDVDKFLISRTVKMILELGYDVYATKGTYEFLSRINEVPASGASITKGLDVQSLLACSLQFFEDTIGDSLLHAGSSHKCGRLLCCYKPSEEGEPKAVELMKSGVVDMFINAAGCAIPNRLSDGYVMRRAAVDNKVTLITSMKLAKLFIDALVMRHIRTAKGKLFFHNKSHQEYLN